MLNKKALKISRLTCSRVAGPFSNVPHPPNRCYIDRKDIYSEMEHRLLMCGARVALVGLGGVGYEPRNSGQSDQD